MYERKVLNLMSLMEKGWVSSGRVPELFIWPCLFVITDCEAEVRWQPTEEGRLTGNDNNNDEATNDETRVTPLKKLTRAKFYDRYKLRDVFSRTAYNVKIKEVLDFLNILTRHVPWLPSQQRGSKDGLAKSLDWLLENLDWCRDVIERCNNKDVEGDGGKVQSDKFLPKSFKNKSATDDFRQAGTPVDSVEKLHVPRGEELGEEDIKDEDMHLYLRTQEEMDNISQLNADCEPG